MGFIASTCHKVHGKTMEKTRVFVQYGASFGDEQLYFFYGRICAHVLHVLHVVLIYMYNYIYYSSTPGEKMNLAKHQPNRKKVGVPSGCKGMWCGCFVDPCGASLIATNRFSK